MVAAVKNGEMKVKWREWTWKWGGGEGVDGVFGSGLESGDVLVLLGFEHGDASTLVLDDAESWTFLSAQFP